MTQLTGSTFQEALSRLTEQTEQNALGIYQSIMSNLANAANLAALPNWKDVLEDEFEEFRKEVTNMGKETKDALQNHVSTEQLLEVRSAISSGMLVSVDNAIRHKDKLIDLIERLKADPRAGEVQQEQSITSSFIDLG